MCGIVGVIGSGEAIAPPVLKSMARALIHRGPDHQEAWSDGAAGVGLGNSRLAIVELSRQGDQPMVSSSGRYVITFNGEIYNFLELRAELARHGHAFRARSDTEVMLAAIEQWGVAQAVSRFNGMFAFALWDRAARTLYLARDRLGEKPLYYGWMNGVFLFGSELKTLRANPAFCAEIDRQALALLLRYGYILEPYSIYRGVYKLPPGTILSVAPGAGANGRGAHPVPYWSARQAAVEAAAEPWREGEAQALLRLEELLCDAIRLRMIADVPLGLFLSGGIDSSLLLALMQRQAGHPVKTFTIGFADPNYDEAPYARRVAEHLGSEHTEFYVTDREVRELVARLPEVFDEPFADYSQVPTCLVARLARESVTVTLSGEGSDELFGGYERYLQALRLWRGFGWMPRPMRRGASDLLAAFSPQAWDRLMALPDRFLPARFKQVRWGDKLHKLAEVLGDCAGAETLYLGLLSYWPSSALDGLLIDGSEPPTILNDPAERPALANFIDAMMYLDLVSYLPGDILVKADRATMGVSLEGRMPFLDHRVVEFALRLPLSLKFRGGLGKHLLRRLLDRYVARRLVARPKMGFGAPVGVWLRGPLRDWAEALLDPRRLSRQGFFHPEPIRRQWSEHLSGRRNHQFTLWAVLMFQAWLEQWH